MGESISIHNALICFVYFVLFVDLLHKKGRG